MVPGGHFSFKLYSKDHRWPPLGYRANNCVQGLLGRTTFCFPPKQAILSGFSALDWVITLSQIGLSPPPQQGFEPASPPDSSTGPRKNHLQTTGKRLVSVVQPCPARSYRRIASEPMPSYHWCGSWGRSVCKTCRETRL